MTESTARKRHPPQDGAGGGPLRRAAGLILLFNGLLVALVLLKPVSDATLALLVNAAQFVGPLLAALPLCFGGLLGLVWGRGVSRARGGSEGRRGQRWGPGFPCLGLLRW